MTDSLLQMMRLKQEVRTGWTLRGVELPESVADHSWGTALLCLAYAEQADVDGFRCVEMAIVHDLAEAVTGDIPTRLATMNDTAREEQKRRREQAAMERLVGSQEQGTVPNAGKMKRLWQEYEAGRSAEACFVRDMNLIDMCLQAVVYERDGRNDPQTPDDGSGYPGLSEFFATTEPRLATVVGKRLFAEVNERYQQLPSVRQRRGP